MKLSWMAFAFALASAAGISSCALLTQGTTEEINVSSEPPGATVTLNSGETKVTPFSIVVPREQDLQFHFSKPGYQSADVSDNSKVEAGYMAADIIPLMLPWAIDASNGAGFAHQQTSVTAHLDPIEGDVKESPTPRSSEAFPQARPKTDPSMGARAVN